eukprot:GEMP01024973.1.p1 GENE.GEMP01024973.1~~GEMP01024973.1.p1  ORF type:complete len:264 (+),score=44.76 GEMP01024973.1:286-1077(+)
MALSRMPSGVELRIKVHKGKFHRSFSKFGKMDPFVLLSPIHEPSRSQRARIAKKNNMVSAAHPGGHLSPEWEWDFPAFRLGDSRELWIDVYDRNSLHKNTHMGTAVLSLNFATSDAHIQELPCSVVKREHETGIIWVSITCNVPIGSKHIQDEMLRVHHDAQITQGCKVTSPVVDTQRHIGHQANHAYAWSESMSSSHASDMTYMNPPNLPDSRHSGASHFVEPLPEEVSLPDSRGMPHSSRKVALQHPPSCLDGVVKFLLCS